MQVKSPNCLIKNLTEMDSLPHLRNPTEISVLIDGMEGKGEVDDERKKVGCEGDGGALAQRSSTRSRSVCSKRSKIFESQFRSHRVSRRSLLEADDHTCFYPNRKNNCKIKIRFHGHCRVQCLRDRGAALRALQEPEGACGNGSDLDAK